MPQTQTVIDKPTKFQIPKIQCRIRVSFLIMWYIIHGIYCNGFTSQHWISQLKVSMSMGITRGAHPDYVIGWLGCHWSRVRLGLPNTASGNKSK